MHHRGAGQPGGAHVFESVLTSLSRPAQVQRGHHAQQGQAQPDEGSLPEVGPTFHQATQISRKITICCPFPGILGLGMFVLFA